MSTALLQSTQITITCSVQITTDREAELLNVLFFLLAPIGFFWHLKQKVNRFWIEWTLLAVQIKDLLTFIGKIMAITFTAFAYGLGVKR